MRQNEDSLWLVMHRETGESRVMRSAQRFVNNHFATCTEDQVEPPAQAHLEDRHVDPCRCGHIREAYVGRLLGWLRQLEQGTVGGRVAYPR